MQGLTPVVLDAPSLVMSDATRGKPFVLRLRCGGAAATLLALGQTGPCTPVSGLGGFCLGLSSVLASDLLAVPPSGELVVNGTVPNLPFLLGLPLAWQSLVQDPTGVLRLSGVSAFTVD